MTASFSLSELKDIGFTGFVPLHQVSRRDTRITTRPGVYVVLLGDADPTAFLPESVGGHFKGTDPTVPVSVLLQQVVADAHTLYIGKANSLQRRIGEYAEYGRGKPIGHRGGRLIWQLRDHEKLRVAWLVAEDPSGREAVFVADFLAAYGRLPFANLVQPSIRVAA